MMPETKVKPGNRLPYSYRKIGKRGGTRSISIGRILPPDWLIVKLKVIELKDKVCILQITKLD